MPYREYFAKAVTKMEALPGPSELTLVHEQGTWTATLYRQDAPELTFTGPSLLDALSSLVENFHH